MSQDIKLDKVSFRDEVSNVKNSASDISKGKQVPSIIAQMEALKSFLEVYKAVMHVTAGATSYVKGNMKKLNLASNEMERTDKGLITRK
jgi:hypothetical protein